MRRNIIMIALIAGAFSINPVQAQDAQKASKAAVAQNAESTTFEVKGKCGMCKKRIEKAALELEGVQSATWNVETKKLSVKYEPSKVTDADIQKKVASVGHDTELVNATEDVYKSLPGCCKYER